MPLTEEQRLRIEENKRKALEKRKNQLQNQTVPVPKTNTSFNDRVGGPSEKSKSIPAEDLRLRMEENKRKAIEKRNQLQNQNQSVPQNNTITNFYGAQSSSSKPKLDSAEEIRLRIEENKRKAIEKRNQLQTQNQTLPKAGESKSDPAVAGKSTDVKSFYGGNNAKPSQTQKQNLIKSINSNSGSKLYPTHLNTSSPSNSGNKQKVVGKCILQSADRFVIDVGYQVEVIAIFKKSKTGAYNATNRSWSFKIQEHDDILQKLRPLQNSSNVQVEPLPNWILQTFKMFKSTLMKPEDVDMTGIEPTLFNALMPFQRDGVVYALQRRGRILLADDMGLGKTIQALAVASAYQKDWPLLIVCPSSVRFSWRSAIFRWLPSVPEEDVIVITSGKDEIETQLVIIISYELMNKRQEELIRHVHPNVAILDESHHIKSDKSARTKAAKAVLKDCSRILCLSGTPALSRPIELFSQINLIDPKLFPYCTDFGMRYCDGKKISFGPNKSHHDFSGSSNMEELKLLLEQRLMIRRMKSEVLPQLPSKQRKMVILDPNLVKSKSNIMKNQAKQYKNDKSMSSTERRGVLLEWYHTTSGAKSRAVCDYLKDLIESGNKFLCFAHHATMMNTIADTLNDAQVHFIRIDGGTSSSMRKTYCDAFQTDDNVRVALLSITAANSGLTLTAAQLVVFAELFWNPGILTQAEDRAHRIGQTDCVTVQYLVATGTADDELWPIIQKKLDVLNKAGLSKDNFKDSESHTVSNATSTSNGDSKITDYFSTSFTEEDIAALDDEWNGDDINISGLTDDWDGATDENTVDNQVKKSVSDLSESLNDFKNTRTNSENDEETPSQAKRRKTFLPPFRK